MGKLHRDSQKRIYFDDAVYFVTCKAKDNRPFFRERIFCDLFTKNLRICKELKGFKLFGWVLCLDHFHLLIKPNDDFNVSKIMQFLKRHVTRDINWIFNPSEGAIRESRLRGGYYERYKSLIIAHDEKLKSLRIEFFQKHPNQNHPLKFHWQKSYHDHIIRNDDDFEYHFEYIKFNPEKHHLPKKWPYIFTNPKYTDLIDECEI